VIGPGKYDKECTAAREATGGSVLLIVLNGKVGAGFSAQIADPRALIILPQLLRDVADQIEQSHEGTPS
jgi:hypothetical protein